MKRYVLSLVIGLMGFGVLSHANYYGYGYSYYPSSYYGGYSYYPSSSYCYGNGSYYGYGSYYGNGYGSYYGNGYGSYYGNGYGSYYGSSYYPSSYVYNPATVPGQVIDFVGNNTGQWVDGGPNQYGGRHWWWVQPGTSARMTHVRNPYYGTDYYAPY